MTVYLDYTGLVRSALLAAPALAGGYVQRGRAFALPEDRDAGIFVRPGRSLGTQQLLTEQVNRFTTELVIELRARGTGGQDALEAVNALLSDVYQRMAAAAVPQGLASWVANVGIDFDAAEADETLGAATLVLRVEHFTGPGSLAAYPT